MLCEELMKGPVQCIKENEPVSAAAKLMRDQRIGFLPVCDDAGRAVGAITDRDIVVRVVADGGSLDVPVSQAMTKNLVTCGPKEKVARAEERMRLQRTARIIGVDEQGKPIGVISLSDLAQHGRAGHIGRLLRNLTTREAHA